MKYQIVSGLPTRNGILHAREIGRLALTILFRINSFKIKHRPDDQVKLRIGVHSGPIVAGVVGRFINFMALAVDDQIEMKIQLCVGIMIPHFCLFGDTISICSRMLTSGEGTVHCTLLLE